jgi:hypothetical protein
MIRSECRYLLYYVFWSLIWLEPIEEYIDIDMVKAYMNIKKHSTGIRSMIFIIMNIIVKV